MEPPQKGFLLGFALIATCQGYSFLSAGWPPTILFLFSEGTPHWHSRSYATSLLMLLLLLLLLELVVGGRGGDGDGGGGGGGGRIGKHVSDN